MLSVTQRLKWLKSNHPTFKWFLTLDHFKKVRFTNPCNIKLDAKNASPVGVAVGDYVEYYYKRRFDECFHIQRAGLARSGNLKQLEHLEAMLDATKNDDLSDQTVIQLLRCARYEGYGRGFKINNPEDFYYYTPTENAIKVFRICVKRTIYIMDSVGGDYDTFSKGCGNAYNDFYRTGDYDALVSNVLIELKCAQSIPFYTPQQLMSYWYMYMKDNHPKRPHIKAIMILNAKLGIYYILRVDDIPAWDILALEYFCYGNKHKKPPKVSTFKDISNIIDRLR